MNSVFLQDAIGNVFGVPIGPEHNEVLARGGVPVGTELILLAGQGHPEYRNLLASASLLFQMCEQAKVMFEAHSEQLQAVGTPALMELGVKFESMAGSIHLAQRQAIEGAASLYANNQNKR